ncbi:MAG: hypothetical protein AAFY42_09795, partial [Pseudomonadota bacterium]
MATDPETETCRLAANVVCGLRDSAMQRLKTYLAMRSVDDLWAHHTGMMEAFGFDILRVVIGQNQRVIGIPKGARAPKGRI